MNDVTLLFDASEQGSGNTLCLEFQNDVFMFAQLFIGPLSGAALPHFGRDGKDADTCFFCLGERFF